MKLYELVNEINPYSEALITSENENETVVKIDKTINGKQIPLFQMIEALKPYSDYEVLNENENELTIKVMKNSSGQENYANKGNLLIIGTDDYACHGVPSYYLWNKYLQEIRHLYHIGSNPNVVFRNKRYPWRKMTISITDNRMQYVKNEIKDDFYAFFRRGLCYMQSCSDCPYREKSSADLRIGDYWGERFKSDKEGVSMVLANTQKGQEMISLLNKENLCDIHEQNLSEYWSVQFPYNPQRPLFRETLISELKEDSIRLKDLRKKYCGGYDFYERYAKYIKLLKKVIRR